MYIFYNTDDKLQIVNEVLLIILIVLDRREKHYRTSLLHFCVISRSIVLVIQQLWRHEI